MLKFKVHGDDKRKNRKSTGMKKKDPEASAGDFKNKMMGTVTRSVECRDVYPTCNSGTVTRIVENYKLARE
jgi:hypothetical protein